MKSRYWCLLAVTLTVWPGVAAAAPDRDGNYRSLGPGNASCGEWTKERKSNIHSAQARQSWVLGYLTAINLYGPWSYDVTKGTDREGLMAWIDNYCASHPLESVAKTMEQLILELTPESISPLNSGPRDDGTP